jgi:hypothetical protein
VNQHKQALKIEGHNVQCFIPSDAHKEAYQKCREDLLKRQLSNTENFDRAILTLSSSLLGLTLTFIRNVIPIEEAHQIWLLLSAWVLLSIAIVVTLLSFQISQSGAKRQMIYAYEYYMNGKEEYLNKPNLFSRLNDWAGYLSAIQFTVAMCFLVAFVWLNIIHGETSMSKSRINIDQEKRGANIPAMQPISKPPASPSSSGISGNGESGSGGQPTNESSGSK